ncbi:MAG: hypothetical protein JWN31_835 [Frankiales bacterium]|nr:hypothetical protein [Frankiales bacterium]
MTVRPSVVDELVVANSTAVPLEVLALGGEPYLRVSSAGVFGNFASADWYATATPEGGPQPGLLSTTPRWFRVSLEPEWAVFDSRLRPSVAVPAGIRAAGADRILTAWRIPLRYGGRAVAAVGHIAFSPVRGGLVVAIDHAPVTATALQGELPGLFVRTTGRLEVTGRDGLPFLRFTGAEVLANTASASWRDDRSARGEAVVGQGWVVASRGQSFSWLDSRLRYPRDEPTSGLDRQQVVLRWRIPVSASGRPAAIEGSVSWVPRAAAVQAIRTKRDERGFPWWLLSAPVALLLARVAFRCRPRRAAART